MKLTAVWVFICCISVSTVIAQEKINGNNQLFPDRQSNKVSSNDFRFINNKINKNLKTANSDTLSRWYNYGQTMDLFVGGPGESSLYWDYLFPDSTIKGYYGSTLYNPWIHSVADALDVTAERYNDSNMFPDELLFLTQTDSFNLDSVGFVFQYERNIDDTNIVDTLIIEVNSVDKSDYWYFGIGNSVSTNLQTDSTIWIGINYDYTKNAMNYNTKKEYTILLTDENYNTSLLSNGYHYMEISTADFPKINPNYLITTTVKFKPGYTWDKTTGKDTLNNKNYVGVVSYNEVGDWGTPYFMSYEKWDLNVSYIIPTNVRYNYSSGWNGYYNPSFAYMWQSLSTYDYVLEHHLISYKVSKPENLVGVKNNTSTNGIKMYPNPATSEFTILGYENNSVIEIYNAMGILVKQISAIETKTTVDTHGLSKGIYIAKVGNQSFKFTIE